MSQNGKCPICGTLAIKEPDYDSNSIFWSCPICGRFELDSKLLRTIDRNHLASYLQYNKFEEDDEYMRYHSFEDKETCDRYKQECDNGNNIAGRPVHIDSEMVENWYPKTFTERVDYILLYLNQRAKHLGEQVPYHENELYGIMFVDRWEKKDKWEMRASAEFEGELHFVLDLLAELGYIQKDDVEIFESKPTWGIRLTTGGYNRIDILQKNHANGRNALVAMQFRGDTSALREAIRKGIKEAGYNAVFIDEVQHNDFITPELLKYIRDSKFVVADLTHQNNGAYFEEGYAMGLGKPVIQLCKDGVSLHFDIAQKNTIMWKTEADIPVLLSNRIKATID